MRKEQRIGIKLVEELGLVVVETYHNRHFTIVCMTTSGKKLNVQIPTNLSEHCCIHNMKRDIKRRVRELEELKR